MQIEVTTTDEGVHGGEEAWVTVTTDEVADWPTVQRQLTPEQKVAMREMESVPCKYFPGDSPDHKYSDIWVFRHRRDTR